MEREGVRERITQLCLKFQAQAIARRDARFPGLSGSPIVIVAEYGLKRARIVREEDHGLSAAGFVDLDTGDVLYAASWSAPAKHARGNVFNDDGGLGAFGDYGVKTLR